MANHVISFGDDKVGGHLYKMQVARRGRARIKLAEEVGFEPTLGLLPSLISSHGPSTTQPPFRASGGWRRMALRSERIHCACVCVRGRLIHRWRLTAAFVTAGAGRRSS